MNALRAITFGLGCLYAVFGFVAFVMASHANDSRTFNGLCDIGDVCLWTAVGCAMILAASMILEQIVDRAEKKGGDRH